MWRRFWHAFGVWLAGGLIGAIPLLAHLVAYSLASNNSDLASGWTADVIFIAITIAGTSVLQTVVRLSGPLKRLETGVLPLVFTAVSVVTLAIAALVYGSYAPGAINDPAKGLFAACMTLAGAIGASLATELVLSQYDPARA